jgi:hypothetical protein
MDLCSTMVKLWKKQISLWEGKSEKFSTAHLRGFFACFCSTRITLRVLHLLGKCSTTWATTPAHFVFILFLRQGLTNFAWAGLKLSILLPQLSSWDYIPSTSYLAATVGLRCLLKNPVGEPV